MNEVSVSEDDVILSCSFCDPYVSTIQKDKLSVYKWDSNGLHVVHEIEVFLHNDSLTSQSLCFIGTNSGLFRTLQMWPIP
jgi:hypothetical protein